MPLRKITIALPANLVAEVDQAARSSHESRSRFVTRALRKAVRARRDAAITKRLDELFADPLLAQEQRQNATSLDVAGTDWPSESW